MISLYKHPPVTLTCIFYHAPFFKITSWHVKVHSFVLTASTSTFFCLISLEYLRISSRCLSTVSFNFVKTSISFSSVSENTKNKSLTLNLSTLRNINYITIVVINWCHRAREFHLNYNPDRCFFVQESEQIDICNVFFFMFTIPTDWQD